MFLLESISTLRDSVEDVFASEVAARIPNHLVDYLSTLQNTTPVGMVKSFFLAVTAFLSVWSPSVQAQVGCPDYTSYAQVPHEPLSTGPLKLPFMRPTPECRTFNSNVVEVK